MSKSRASKTKAAGLLIGQTKYSKPYRQQNQAVPVAMNRAMRRANGQGARSN